MKKAWEIAKGAAKQHGGKAVEYIGGALKMAWAMAKKASAPKYVEVEVSEGSRKHKSYIAKIVGLCERFGLSREFVSSDHESKRAKVAVLFNGNIYELQDAGERRYVRIADGQMHEMEYVEVQSIFA